MSSTSLAAVNNAGDCNFTKAVADVVFRELSEQREFRTGNGDRRNRTILGDHARLAGTEVRRDSQRRECLLDIRVEDLELGQTIHFVVREAWISRMARNGASHRARAEFVGIRLALAAVERVNTRTSDSPTEIEL